MSLIVARHQARLTPDTPLKHHPTKPLHAADQPRTRTLSFLFNQLACLTYSQCPFLLLPLPAACPTCSSHLLTPPPQLPLNELFKPVIDYKPRDPNDKTSSLLARGAVAALLGGCCWALLVLGPDAATVKSSMHDAQDSVLKYFVSLCFCIRVHGPAARWDRR